MDSFQNVIKPSFPDPTMMQSKASYSSKTAIIETTFIPSGECGCDGFTFLIPLRQPPSIRTHGKLCKLNARSVFPCNPFQKHSVVSSKISNFKAYVLYIEAKHLRQTAESMFGGNALELENRCFHFSTAFNELISAFISEFQAMQPGYELLLQSFSFQVAVIILRESCHNLSNIHTDPKEYRDGNSIKKAIDFLTDNYQSAITLQEVAEVTNYSPYHFLRLFKTHTGKTPFEYLLDIKIEKAKSLLQEKDCTISYVCDLSGFNSCSYFTQVFKKKMGLTPTQFKNSL
jgi:AraC family transcriptional regulator